MKIIIQLLHTIFALFILFILTRTLEDPHQDFIHSQDSFIFSKGNASENVRVKIIDQLNKFQDGYTKRDTSQIDSFMQQLFSKENVLILGTMPNEICVGQKGARRLVFADWYAWGDCTFLVENSNVSSYGDAAWISTLGYVAWISTLGYVKFDLSSLLVLPFRLTGVMVKENDLWKFQQMQFQFDLDLTFLLIAIFLMIIWVTISTIKLIVVIIRFRNKPGTT